LIIDEIGYLSLARQEANLRYEKGATILTSILTFGSWLRPSPEGYVPQRQAQLTFIFD
jgi:DNA replication protein DnaC